VTNNWDKKFHMKVGDKVVWVSVTRTPFNRLDGGHKEKIVATCEEHIIESTFVLKPVPGEGTETTLAALREAILATAEEAACHAAADDLLDELHEKDHNMKASLFGHERGEDAANKNQAERNSADGS
jgi:hypothetical protein